MKLKKISANATLLHNNDFELLFSYDKPVAAYSEKGGFVRTELFHSSVTTRHISQYIGKNSFRLVPQIELDEMERNWSKA